MKAVVVEEHGGPEVLRYKDVPDPQPGPGEVVIRVRALTANPGPDVLTREGRFGLPGFELPHVGGSDPAGEVVAVGEGVTSPAVGDRVVVYPILSCGDCDACRRGAGGPYCRRWRLWGAQTWGGRAEYARLPASNAVALPDGVSFEAAAAAALSYNTTWHGVVDRGRLSAEDTLLVTGAAGGCGVAAIQIGRLFGARVIAISGAEWKRVRAVEIGADHAFDSRDPDWPRQVREVTDGRGASIVLDSVGDASWPLSTSCLDHGGRFLCCGTTTGSAMAFDAREMYRKLIAMHFWHNGTKPGMETLLSHVAAGEIDPVIDSRFALEDTAEAERKLAAQDHFGKIVLLPPAPGGASASRR
ncbi:Crotonyl-CoA reductase [Baekduia alba]|uniref:alcohol dehydrogenase catalytic domain-containing protein n=1 Tax=Baekduia alba TaxID=2997333 RepID=UPI002341533D|nr:zinc-binding dehydrogenase [Baekduia alba]WCB91765.1 Crotonyl-CoA reductase [Baekduia alba]